MFSSLQYRLLPAVPAKVISLAGTSGLLPSLTVHISSNLFGFMEKTRTLLIQVKPLTSKVDKIEGEKKLNSSHK